MRIRDSVAFFTGANRGIGLAFATALLDRGAKKVYAGVRNPNGANRSGVIPVKFGISRASGSIRSATAPSGPSTTARYSPSWA
jgi:NAD(P)-dependent dehydrogenase (short-subunit alcohol dehydrogenase family)